MKFLYILFTLVVFAQVPYYLAKSSSKSPVVENVVDIKEFKKILRTKNNVLICFIGNAKQSSNIIRVFKEAAVVIKGLGTMVMIDCSGEGKKTCKKLKVNADPYMIKHYKDGEFNKDYDRKDTVNSMVNFMRDPTGDLPWEEDPTAKHVYHISDAMTLAKFIKKESKPMLIMFYAPWCGFCKTLKPEYAEAASDLQRQAVLAAIDVNRPENSVIRTQYNISGFPTLLYYEHGVLKYTYEGENTRHGIVTFMKNPQAPPVKIKEPEWSDTDSEIVHLTTTSFEPVLKEESSVLIMFYAPWCGHCKKMKPEYEKAAAQLKVDGVPGMLAALDATKEQTVASKFGVKGYPTLKYFSFGDFKFDVNVREAPKLVSFMSNPQEPPPPPPPEVPWSEQKNNVVHLTEENFKSFLKKKKHVLVMFYTPWCGHCKKAKPEFSRAAEKFKDDPKVEFAAVDCTSQDSLCNSNEVRGYPTIKYYSYYSKVIKKYSGGRTEHDFVKYMSDPEYANAPPVPLKEEWKLDSNKVVQLTDNTFRNHINTKEPVLVMFYAPWCGHCKKMKPDYARAANELAAEGVDCKLAMVDCTVNPELTEQYEISGFPTIKLFQNGRYIEDYKGKRSHEDLKSYLKRNTKSKDEL